MIESRYAETMAQTRIAHGPSGLLAIIVCNGGLPSWIDEMGDAVLPTFVFTTQTQTATQGIMGRSRTGSCELRKMMMPKTFSFIVATVALSIILIGVAGSEEPQLARPTVEQARRQAELLHTSIHATLQVVHQRYYREDEGIPIPAGVLKDVFADLKKEHQVSLRWLAVDGQAMNTDHVAKDEFEKEAVKALQADKGAFERSEGGFYRRASAITLGSHCLKCHVPDRKSTEERTAGLIISMPVQN